MSEKVIDIKKTYSKELHDIQYILTNLESGRYYENTGAQGDGYLATNIIKLRKEISMLLNEIQYGRTTSEDELDTFF